MAGGSGEVSGESGASAQGAESAGALSSDSSALRGAVPVVRPRAIIAGFGLPGRAIADDLEGRGVEFSVIEINPEVIARCGKLGRKMVAGDVREPAVLVEAGLATAEIVALMVPVEAIVLEAIGVIRGLRPDVQIVARTQFTSIGLEARTRGANVVIVAEQVVASAARNAVGARLT